MAPYDYSGAPPQRSFDLIPHGTVADLSLHIQPGNAGPGGILKRSKDGSVEMLSIEWTVIAGEHKSRKLWSNLVVEGGTTAGHAQAIDISRGVLKAIIDCAKGLDPNDNSDAARAVRTLDYPDFDGLTVVARIGIEKGALKPDGSGDHWPDKNVLLEVITKGRKDWHSVEPVPPFNGGGNGGRAGAQASAPINAAPPITRPDWA